MTCATRIRTRIAILCGGLSNEREVSLLSGKEVFNNLDRTRYIPTLIEILRDGECVILETDNAHSEQKTFGIPPYGNLGELKKYADVVFNALHGTFGEDGRIQSLLEILDIPYTGSGVLPSALAMNKEKTFSFLRNEDIPFPKTVTLRKDQLPSLQIKSLPLPSVVKPNCSGSSIGVAVVSSHDQLHRAIHDALQEDNTILVQEYIQGKELTCGVLGNADDPESIQALLPVEIIFDDAFFDYRAKYDSEKTEEICPAKISPALTKKIQELAKQVHTLLGCRGLTRSDFILKGHTLYFLEINTLPGLTEKSLCPKEARAAGMPMMDFLTRQIELART